MGCGPEVAGSVYHPRRPQQTPFYQLVARFYPQFEAVYSERYQERYGFWRPVIGTVVGKFLECGDLKHGFARVRSRTSGAGNTPDSSWTRACGWKPVTRKGCSA